MNDEKAPKIESECPDSVSFPNTRANSTKPLETKSKVFKFMPLKSDVLLKMLLEEAYSKDEKAVSEHKTSHVPLNEDTINGSSSVHNIKSTNIIDKSLTEDNCVCKDKDLISGVTWLDTPLNKKPFKVEKSTPSTVISDMFNKLSVKDLSSAKKPIKPHMTVRREEEKEILKTPICKNSKIFNTESTTKKLSSSNVPPLSANKMLSSKKKLLETPILKQKLSVQLNKNFETPTQNSVLQAAIRKNSSLTLSSTIRDKVILNSVKKVNSVLREKNKNTTEKQKVDEEKHVNNEKLVERLHPLLEENNEKFVNNEVNKSDVIVKKKQTTEVEKHLINEEVKKSVTDLSDKHIIVEKQRNEEEKQIKNPNNVLQEINQNTDIQKKDNKEEKPLLKIPQKSLQELTVQKIKVKGKDYIVINKIGEGGSGQVYRCLEQETLLHRAIKVVNLNVDATTLNNYINEVKMLKDLQGNKRVIKMFTYEQINQALFIVMEVGDVDFAMFLRSFTSESQIQTHIIICYWVEMLECVKEIHKKGIIHSDLKPSNFLIVAGRLKLIDFGIASRLSADMTSIIKNVTVGTFNYISPEALLDSRECPNDEKPQLRISYKSDVWSLGCILYQMVYKRTPFQSIPNMWAKFAAITDRNHKIDYPQLPGVPLYLINMIKNCLIYDMRSRPTVEELLSSHYSGYNF